MSDLLFYIPIVPWVQETMQKMNIFYIEKSPEIWNIKKSRKIWSGYWYDTYKKLGGETTSGKKPCPMCAAYGLWYLGRIVDSVQTCKDWEILQINHELGKNVAYTVISLEILQQQGNNTNKEALWPGVQELYQQRLNKKAAKEEQGEIQIALALFNANLIIFP